MQTLEDACRRNAWHLIVKCPRLAWRPCWECFFHLLTIINQSCECLHTHRPALSTDTCIVKNQCTMWKVVENLTTVFGIFSLLCLKIFSPVYIYCIFVSRGKKENLQNPESALSGNHSQSPVCPSVLKCLVPLLSFQQPASMSWIHSVLYKIRDKVKISASCW